MKKVTFECPMPPTVNHSNIYRSVRRGNKNIVLCSKTPAYNKFMKDMKPILENLNWTTTPKNEFLCVEMEFYFSKKGEDSDNRLKALLDSFQKNNIVENDSQILPKVNRVYIDKNNPRVTVNIFVSENKGLFNNSKQFDTFKKNNCFLCTKNEEKCKIIKQLLENRVIKEANCDKCMAIVSDL